MSDFNERDKELLEKFGMTEEQVSSDVERMESEDAGHGITGSMHLCNRISSIVHHLLRSPHAAETGRAHGHRHHKDARKPARTGHCRREAVPHQS